MTTHHASVPGFTVVKPGTEDTAEAVRNDSAPLVKPPVTSPSSRQFRGYTRTYSRISDDSSSTFAGHPTWNDAADDAASIVASRDPDIVSVWIRGIEDDGSLGPVIWFTGLDPSLPVT